MMNVQKNIALKYGLPGAAAVIGYFWLFYSVRKALFLHPGVQWGVLIIYVACMYFAAREDHTQNGAQRDIRARLQMPFTVFVLMTLGYWMFYYGLHLADPELLRLELTMQVDFLQQQLNAGTGDPQQANKMRAQVQELQQSLTRPLRQPLGPVVLQLAQGLLGGGILALGACEMARFLNRDERRREVEMREVEMRDER